MWKDKNHKRMKFESMEKAIKSDIVICLVKEGESQVLGCIQYVKIKEDTARFEVLGVHKDHMKKGYAKILIDACENKARSQEIATMELQVLSPRVNPTPEREWLLQWYNKKLGYSIIKTEKHEELWPELADDPIEPCDFIAF